MAAKRKSLDVRVKENDKARVALDKQIAALRGELAVLNREARELNAEQQMEVAASIEAQSQRDAEASGAVFTTSAR